MNRAQRRAAQKNAPKYPSWLPTTKEARVKRLMQQGISPQDLEREYNAGFDEGFRQAAKPMIRSYYAATILAAHKLFGFGQERCIRLLNEVERNILETLTSTELSDQVMDEMKIEIDFNDPFERAKEKGEAS